MGKLTPLRRIKKRDDFKRIQHLGNNRLTNKYFFLYYCRTNCKSVGIQLGRRYLDKSVARNKLKRLISEYLRLHQDLLPCVSLVIGVRRKIDDLSSTELRQYFYKIIEALILRCK